MNSNYETYTQYKMTLPIAAADLRAGSVFELGHPVQSVGGVNGFMTADSVWDTKSGQVYMCPVVLAANTAVGTRVYFNTATGGLTATAGALNVFGRIVRVAEEEVFPATAGTRTLGVMLVNP